MRITSGLGCSLLHSFARGPLGGYSNRWARAPVCASQHHLPPAHRAARGPHPCKQQRLQTMPAVEAGQQLERQRAGSLVGGRSSRAGGPLKARRCGAAPVRRHHSLRWQRPPIATITAPTGCLETWPLPSSPPAPPRLPTHRQVEVLELGAPRPQVSRAQTLGQPPPESPHIQVCQARAEHGQQRHSGRQASAAGQRQQRHTACEAGACVDGVRARGRPCVRRFVSRPCAVLFSCCTGAECP